MPPAIPRGREVLIAGPSMRPTLEIGDVVVLEEAGDVRWGDVMVFSAAGETICHRVLLGFPWVGGWRFVHQGDAQESTPGIVGESEVLGRVAEVRRGGRAERLMRRRATASEMLGGLAALTRAARRVLRRRVLRKRRL